MDIAPALIADLATRALTRQTTDGVTEMLADIARRSASHGCILWEVAGDASTPDRAGHIYVLTQWFPHDFYAIHNLPFTSVTGYSIQANEPTNVPDIDEDQRVYRGDSSFLADQGIRSFCSIPLQMQEGRRGALNVYRTSLGGFDAAEMSTLTFLASLMGPIYNALTERVSRTLLQDVSHVLSQTITLSSHAAEWRDEVRQTIQVVTEKTATATKSEEVSVFLRDDLPHSGHLARPTFSLISSTWRGEVRRTTYTADAADGLTGSVLASRKPFRFMDLAHFRRDIDGFHPEFPGLRWTDALAFEELVRQAADAGTKLPPMSFMAAPIVIGNELLGVVRCSMARSGCYYYTDRELQLLDSLAGALGLFLERARTQHLIQGENEAWKAVITSVGQLNHFVHSELLSKAPSEMKIFDEALQVMTAVIPGAEIMDVRLYDAKKKVLKFAHVRGKSWQEGSPAEIKRRLNRKFGVGSRKISSAGDLVMRNRQVYFVVDPPNDPYYSETFPGVTQMIIAPIMVHDTVYGVLDMRATGEVFPPHAAAVADLLGRQLGLYHFLASTIRELGETEVKLTKTLKKVERMKAEQEQAFEDLAHQLKTPIGYAHARAQVELSPKALANSDPKTAARMLAIRGHIGKLRRVTMSLRLLIDLARGEMPQPDLVPINRGQLIKLLIETAVDHESMNDPARPVRFQVNRDSFDLLDRIVIEGSWDLLEQAVNTLLDNAGKYSFGNTEVRIYGGTTTGGRFHISVSSEGLTLRGIDVGKAKIRRWRSDEAKDVTGEGTGIGLWVVDNIMKAQGGELVINSTGPDRRTDIKLVFPIKRGLVHVRYDRGR
jgi:signal transduction histidine kinase/GAF domain-containing protein